MPAHRQQGCLRGEPGPVHPGIDAIRKRPNLRLERVVTIEIASGEQHPAEHQRRIDRRQFAVAVPLAVCMSRKW